MERKIRNRRTYSIKICVVISAIIILAVASCMFLRSAYVVPVLMYHKIDGHSKDSKLSVSPQGLERQMRFLREHRYNIVSLKELVALLSSGRPLPHKTIAVTFDDGYKDNYTDAFPVLKKYNIPASIFVVVDKIGRAGYMEWKDLKEMSGGGVDIGSHTLSECYLPDVKEEGILKKEILESRLRLKSRIPEGGEFFAYPSGGFDKRIRQIVIDSGYKGACATNPGKRYPADDIYAIKRLRISMTSDNLFVFWIESSGLYTWIKEHRDED